MGYFIVFIGSGIGGALRYGVGVLSVRLFGFGFPIGSFAINVVGSFLMALIAEYFALKSGFSQPWRLFLTTGIVGGFTTFSTFSLDAVSLYERNEIGFAALYVIGSIVVSLAAFFFGLWVVRSIA
jgi:CrcB protein